MNRHTKIAIFVFPFLMLGGYIASGYYIDYQTTKDKVVQLVPNGACNILKQTCILESGDFQINVFDLEGITQVNSTFPLDNVTLFILNDKKQITVYPMRRGKNQYYWEIETQLRKALSAIEDNRYTLRIIANIKGGKYISEFTTQSI